MMHTLASPCSPQPPVLEKNRFLEFFKLIKYILAPTVQGWIGSLVPVIRLGKTIMQMYLKRILKGIYFEETALD